MERTLILTSPHMLGEDVKRAQYVMNGHNEFGTDFYRGELDGDYGALTSQAAFRAHYWLGFTLKDLNRFGHRYGDVLDGLLTGSIKLSKSMRSLRNARMRAAGETPMRVKAFNHMMSHLGLKENPPGSNRCYASDWYGLIGPWCAMAVTEAYVVGASSQAFVRGSRYAYVPYMEADARAGRNFLAITLWPQRGDVACYDWDDDGIADHTGLFSRWLDQSRGVFESLEGNTSASSDSNGGEVMLRQRSTSDLSLHNTTKPAFIHVGH